MEMSYVVMRERVHENESGMTLVHRSYIGKRQKLVDQFHAKKYDTVERAETALTDFVLKSPQYLGQLIIVLA